MVIIEELIKKLKEKHGRVFITEIGHRFVLWRELTRQEYRNIMNTATSEEEIEERICQAAVLYPKVDFATGLAGIPQVLAPQIVEVSGFGNPDQAFHYIDQHREHIERSFETQAEVIIKAAFPDITFKEMRQWSVYQLTERLVQAEWKLKFIDKVTLEFNGPEAPAQDADDEGLVVDPEEARKELRETAAKMREQGVDPIFALAPYILTKKPYVEFPFITGTDWRNEAVWNGIRQSKQRVSEH